MRAEYSLLETLRQGPQATTYLAQGPLGKVILKQFSLQKSTSWKDMELFEREAQTLMSLKHPGIPRLLKFEQSMVDNHLCMSLLIEYIEAPSLEERFQQGGHLTQAQVLNLGKDLLEILRYLHQLSPPVIHRDIKPSNLLLDKNNRVYLIDFGGVQTRLYPHDGRGSTIIGTYGYMAPEQFAGKAVPQSDLYSVGATLIHLLSGIAPSDMPQKGLHLDFEPHIHVSEFLLRWLQRLLAPDPTQRFASAQEALESLQNQSVKQLAPRSRVPDLNAFGIQLQDTPDGLIADISDAMDQHKVAQVFLSSELLAITTFKKNKSKVVFSLNLNEVSRCFMWVENAFRLLHTNIVISYQPKRKRLLPGPVEKKVAIRAQGGLQEMLNVFNQRFKEYDLSTEL